MPDTFSVEEPEVIATLEESPRLAEPDTPFRIALMGDWSGRSNRKLSAEKFEAREPMLIDRDDFDEVMARLGVSLRLTVAGEGSSQLTLRFQELDDFHPDRIFERVELFDALRRMRERLEDDSTFAEAAREMRGLGDAKEIAEAEVSSDRQAVPASENVDPASGGSLLDQMLEEASGEDEQAASLPAVSSQADDELRAMLRDAVRPYLVSTDEARQAELIASVDEATSRLMRSILHHADFQSLEAAWRAAHLLTSRLETCTDLKLYLLDVTKAELATSDELEASAIYKLLVDKSVNTFGGDLWAVIAGNYTFDATPEDTGTLERLAQIAKRTGAPFISAASPRVLGCESLAATPDPDDWRAELDAESRKAWDALRQQPESTYLGLALPRFLLRLPYGAETEPLEQFDFEELTGSPAHENYLWGNPAFACALLLGQAFTEYGWDMQPGIRQEIEGLPLHVFEDEGDAYIKPCAETLLTMRAAERVMNEGLMPLLSFQGSDAVRLARFQSLAEPPQPLAGAWR
ncbi:MAG TPA: type VI secretion system contractile sheath large subunit [Pyrinomonadaceae bacterium]